MGWRFQFVSQYAQRDAIDAVGVGRGWAIGAPENHVRRQMIRRYAQRACVQVGKFEWKMRPIDRSERTLREEIVFDRFRLVAMVGRVWEISVQQHFLLKILQNEHISDAMCAAII